MQIIAEIGINHNGDINLAKRLILMAKECGCDFVKFQKRTPDTVYTKEFLDSPRQSPWGLTQRAQKEQLEFGFDQYQQIDDYCNKVGIPWFASAWDVESLEFMDYFEIPLNKICSAMITNLPFLEMVASRKKKTIISTGMCVVADILTACRAFEKADCPCVLMHCVSEYPCANDRCNLEYIRKLKHFCNEVGYSNHSPGILACIGAAFLGAEWLEVHITLDRSMYGSDQSSSIEAPGLRKIVEYCRLAPTLIGDGVKVITAMEKVNAGKLRYWENG